MKKNNSGFGLFELMLTLMVFGGIAYVMLSLKKETKVIESKIDQESIVIVEDITTLLANPANCLATLKGLSAQATAPDVISDIKHDQQSSFPIGYISGNDQLKIKSYSLSATGPDVSLLGGTTHLLISFENKNVQNKEDIVKRIPLSVTIDANQAITSCRSLASTAVQPKVWARGNNGEIYYAGRVGINTTNPRAALEVDGGIRVKKGDTKDIDLTNAGFSFEGDGDTGLFSEGNQVKLKTDGAAGLTVKSGMYYGAQDCFNVDGAEGVKGAIASCPAGSNMISGGGRCENDSTGYLHASYPSGNGWFADCYRRDGTGDIAAIAVVRCCRLAPQ